jgi:hypothetical protein
MTILNSCIVVAADAVLEICTALISADLFLDEHLSQTLPMPEMLSLVGLLSYLLLPCHDTHF